MTDPGELLFRTRGRAAKPLQAELGRELEAADIALLANEKGSTPSPLVRISERHHALARALASGMDHKQAAAIHNYSESRISILLADPAFKELLQFYSAGDTEAVRGLNVKLAELASTAADILLDRMEDEPDKVTVGQLQETLRLAADRTGHGPQSSSTVNVNIDLAARLSEARQRVAQRRLITDAEFTEVSE